MNNHFKLYSLERVELDEKQFAMIANLVESSIENWIQNEQQCYPCCNCGSESSNRGDLEQKLRKRTNREIRFGEVPTQSNIIRKTLRQADLALATQTAENSKKQKLDTKTGDDENSGKKSTMQKSKHQGKAKTFKRKTKRRGRV